MLNNSSFRLPIKNQACMKISKQTNPPPPQKKKNRREFYVFLISLYSIVQFSRCQSHGLSISRALVQDVKCKHKSTINMHFSSIGRVLSLLLLLNSPTYVRYFHKQSVRYATSTS